MAQLLIVDNDDATRTSVGEALTQGGHVVRTATCVAEARHRLAVEAFELVLCDVDLPGESGLALVREMAAERTETAVMLVTAVDDEEVAEAAITVGVYGYLVKPVGPNEVLINVGSALRRWDLERTHHLVRSSRPPTWSEPRVIVVDARPLFTDALAGALAATKGLAVVGTAGSARQAERVLVDQRADVVVMAADLPDGGPDAARRLLAASPGAAVILLAASDDDAMVLRALDVGCAGVVTRDRAFDDLAGAVRLAHRGEPMVAPGRLVALLHHRRARAEAGLTRRETEVLGLMAEGLSNEAIAARLVVSLNTVRNHVQRILTKLSAHSKLEAVAKASRRGLVALS